MRQPKLLGLVFLIPLAAACAAGGSNTGFGGAGAGNTSGGRGGDQSVSSSSSTTGGLSSGFSGSSSTSSGGTSGNPGGCGLTANDPSCDTCLNAACCQEAIDCANDQGCTVCLGTSTPPASCDTDPALAALAGCLQTSCDAECFGGSSSSSSGGGGPLTCDQTDSGIGCCDASGVLHYCNTQMTVTDQPCTGGTVCGWSDANQYYDCVPPPGGPDPSQTYPMACGGGSTSSSSSSSSTSASSSSSSTGGTGVTWTQLYDGIFGPTGTSTCAKNGSCHTLSQSGFKCGTSKSTCYTGMINSGLVIAGSGASSSPLVDPVQSPLCGSLGGSMPKGGTCVTTTQVNQIKSWLAAGAPNN